MKKFDSLIGKAGTSEASAVWLGGVLHSLHLPILAIATALPAQGQMIPSTLSVTSVMTRLAQIGMPQGFESRPTMVASARQNVGPVIKPTPDQDTTTRLEIFLDEHSFGPGQIDGRWGEFVEKALKRFQTANGQQPSGQIDVALQEELQKISPLYTTYTITEPVRWDRAMLNHGRRSGEYYIIPPGPRNPVGIVWIELSKTGIGMHGTDSPNTIGRSASHGCIRLTNWDAARLINQVTVGMTVEIF